MSLPPLDWREEEFTGGEESRIAIPWEDESYSTLPALFLTLIQVLKEPRSFFQRQSWAGGLSDPLSFALLLGSFGLLVSLTWQLMPNGGANSPVALLLAKVMGAKTDPLRLLVLFLFIPLLVAAEQFFSSVCLLAAGKLLQPDFSFAQAFRLLAYAHAALVFSLVPWLGNLLSGLYSMFILFQGLSGSGLFSPPRALGTLLISLFIQGLLLGLALLLAGAWLFGRFWLSLFA